MGDNSDKVYSILLEIKADIGGLKTGLENSNNHILHVSRKADGIREDLDSHKESPHAHRGAVMGALYALLGGVASAVALIKYGKGIEH